jgi:hypothetical protein
MTRRITSRNVKFRHAFWLSGIELPQPAGSYTIDIEEEPSDALAGWRHVSTSLRLYRFGEAEQVGIDPQELREVLMRDGDQDLDPPVAQTGANRAAS